MSETHVRKEAPEARPWLPRVLVAEDSLTRRTWIGDWLHERGFAFRTAKDGAEALGLIQKLPPDERPELVVSDLNMPEMSGEELARALRAHPETRGIAIILYSTSLLDHRDYAEGIRHQAADQLKDAVDFDSLTAAIEQKVQHMRSLKALADVRRSLASEPRRVPEARAERALPASHSGPLKAKKGPDPR